MTYVTVSVSPFYNGRGWTDQATGISFDPVENITAIRIEKENKDLSGIRNSVRLNNLMLLKGDLNDAPEAPTEVNPEELTKVEFNKMFDFLQGKDPEEETNPVIEEQAEKIAKLEAELAELRRQLEEQPEEQEPEVEEPKDVAAVSTPSTPSVTEEELGEKTKDELKAIADEHGIEYKTTDTKAVLIDKIIAVLG